MKNEFMRVIFDTKGYSYDDAKKYLIEDNGIENPTDEDIYEEINNCQSIWINDEQAEFKAISPNVNNKIIVLADVGRWNGRKEAIKFFNSLEDILCFMSHYDDWKLYIDRYQLKGVGHHHDGTDYLTFKEIKSKYNDEMLENFFYEGMFEKIKDNYTSSLRKYFKGYLY